MDLGSNAEQMLTQAPHRTPNPTAYVVDPREKLTPEVDSLPKAT